MRATIYFCLKDVLLLVSRIWLFFVERPNLNALHDDPIPPFFS